MQINIHGNRLNSDWTAVSVRLFLGIYPSIYGVHAGAYAFASLLGYDQFLPKKNTIHANDWVYAGAYAIRPYWVHNRYTQKGIITAHAKRFRFRFPILVRACERAQVSLSDFRSEWVTDSEMPGEIVGQIGTGDGPPTRTALSGVVGLESGVEADEEVVEIESETESVREGDLTVEA